MRPPLLPLLILAGCSMTGAPSSDLGDPTEQAVYVEEDLLARLAERLASPDREATPELMNSLERMLPAWESEKHQLREKPVENIVTIKVVTHFEKVLEQFRSGQRNRRLVAAWALGFSRVPENTLGLRSPHPAAVSALVSGLGERDDELLGNVLLGLWKLRDPATPVESLVDLMLQHHDAQVRANAALALTTVLTDQTAPRARDAVLVALSDSEAKVRLHAASLARSFPHPSTTARIEALLPSEAMPLVRASMAAALGAAGARSAAPLLVDMLASPREIESVTARLALEQIFGLDRGPDPADWADLVR
jgi:hypothetical protein